MSETNIHGREVTMLEMIDRTHLLENQLANARDDNEALRNQCSQLENDWRREREICQKAEDQLFEANKELVERNRTAAIVAGGMKRLADERDELLELNDEAIQILSDIFFNNATGFSIGTFSSLGKRITAVIGKYRALDAAKAKV